MLIGAWVWLVRRDEAAGTGVERTYLAGVDLLESLENVNDPGLDVGLGETCRGGVEADGGEAGGDDGSTGDGAGESHRSASSDERGGSGSESGNHCDWM